MRKWVFLIYILKWLSRLHRWRQQVPNIDSPRLIILLQYPKIVCNFYPNQSFTFETHRISIIHVEWLIDARELDGFKSVTAFYPEKASSSTGGADAIYGSFVFLLFNQRIFGFACLHIQWKHYLSKLFGFKVLDEMSEPCFPLLMFQSISLFCLKLTLN